MKTHNFYATWQFGIISAVDVSRHCVRVIFPTLDNLETAYLPFLTQAAGGNQFYNLPDVGEQAVCLMDANGESGVVLGVTFNNKDTCPANDNNIWRKVFKNGTIIEHNRKNGAVNVQTSGQVTIQAASVVINAPQTTCTGKLNVQGLLTYQAGLNGTGNASISGSLKTTGDIGAGNVSLKQHQHTGDSGGTTSTPK